MNITTPDRPTDSPKYVTFQGIGGEVTKLIYPDLYKTETYTQSGNTLILKTPEQIEIAIKQYLIKVVQKYNSILQGQLSKKTSFYTSKQAAFDRLSANKDPLASPNREYKFFDSQYLIRMLGNDNIKILAHLIYYQNITNQETKI
jgi:hypothetical protein